MNLALRGLLCCWTETYGTRWRDQTGFLRVVSHQSAVSTLPLPFQSILLSQDESLIPSHISTLSHTVSLYPLYWFCSLCFCASREEGSPLKATWSPGVNNFTDTPFCAPLLGLFLKI